MLTVADIVGTEALRLTLRGGLAGAGRPVRWVHISELPDPTPWLRGGELLRETGAGAAGVGRVRTEPGELAGSFDESLYAVEAQPVNGTPSVATFRDLGSIQLLLSLGDERGVELYCESMLGPLRAHDDRYGSALIESLQAYIEANGRWAEAAAALGVHRHTLRYRIRKVEHLTGRSPADARDRLEVWLALRADELQARREPEPVQ